MVDRAKAVLMDTHGMAEDVAFSFIQRSAMDRRARMQVVAQEIIDGTLTP
jgi:two-component system, response regulator PdtaR